MRHLFLAITLALGLSSPAQNQGACSSVEILNAINIGTFIDPLYPQTRLLGFGRSVPDAVEEWQSGSTLMEYLMFRHHVRHLVLKMSFADAALMETYINGESNELMLPDGWKSPSFKALIEYMRERNLSTSDEKQKVHVWGIELASIPLSAKAAALAANTVPELVKQIETMHMLKKTAFDNGLRSLDKKLRDDGEEWTYQTLFGRLLVSSWRRSLLDKNRHSDYAYQASKEAVAEILNRMDNSEKMMLWADNKFLARSSAMGQSLIKLLGNAYTAIGCDFETAVSTTSWGSGGNSTKSLAQLLAENNKGMLWVNASLGLPSWISGKYTLHAFPSFGDHPKGKLHNAMLWQGTATFDYLLVHKTIHLNVP